MTDLFKEEVYCCIYLLWHFICVVHFFYLSIMYFKEWNATFHYIFTAIIVATIRRIFIIPCNQPIFSLKKIASTTASRKITDALNWSNNSPHISGRFVSLIHHFRNHTLIL